MREAMQGVDGIYHVAGWYRIGARDKSDGKKVNVQGTRNVLELMKELRIPRGIYTSTLAVNSDTHGQLVDETYRFTGKHIVEYDRTKALAHDIAGHFISEGLPLIIVMPGLIYGPGDTSALRRSFIAFLQGRLPIIPTKHAYCFAHVDDTAHGHILAMERGLPGETYIIAGEPSTVQNFFQIASHITGQRAPTAAPYQIFDSFLPEIYTSEGMRILAGVTYWGDNRKARRFLGYNPRPMRQGLESTLRHEMSLLGM
jgi:nucleoside-diphosphate-sugar epimerase